MSLFLWSRDPDAVFDGLADQLASNHESVEAVELSELARSEQGDTVVLVLGGSSEQCRVGLEWLEGVGADSGLNIVVVTDDSFLGTDADRSRSQVSGGAVALVRSLAVQRGTTVRANAVCFPESLVEEAGELRGPLPDKPNLEDVAAAVGLFAGSDGGYLSGQVLFVNGGRQLFSSLTA